MTTMQDELKTKLKELGFTDEQIGKLEEQGVVSDAEMAMLSEDDIIQASGATIIAAKRAAQAFAPQMAPSAADTATMQSILPALPDDTSFIEMLKVGGVLKIDRTNVIAAMRAAIADKIGLFGLPAKLVARMEAFATEQEEPVGEPFYRLQKVLTEHRYGELLSALGTNGNLMSEARKRDTLARINLLLWPALRSFDNQLRSWIETWSQGAGNPAMMMMAFTMQSGNRVMPPGMLQPPDTAHLHDAGEAVIDQINKVFAGTGIPVSRALAYDAMRIRQILEDPSLPSTVGAATRDQMIKTMGIAVGADFVRLEQAITRYALGIMELPKVSGGDQELAYFSALYSLGSTVPWDKLVSGPLTTDPSQRLNDAMTSPTGSRISRVRGDDYGNIGNS